MRTTGSVSDRMRTGLLLAGLLLSSAVCGTFTACGASGTETGTELPPSAESQKETETETAELRDSLPEKDFSGAVYHVLTAAEQWQNKYLAEEESGDALNDAVYALNREVEERFHVDMQYQIVNGYTAGTSTVSKLLFESVAAGDTEFDLFCACSAYVGPRILEGVLSNLSDAEYLDFSAPWWYHNVQDNIKVNGNLYIAAGAFGIQTMGQCWSAVYSKELASALDLPDLYGMVTDGKWTFDRFLTFASEASTDLDGDGTMDDKDRYGILQTQYEPYNPLPYAMGRLITETGTDGLPHLTGVSQHNVDVFSKLSELIHDKSLYYSAEIDPAVKMIPMFTSGQGLFMIYPIRILEDETLRAGNDYGVLPLPKYDEEQKQYLTSCFPDISAIPLVVKDEEMSQIVLEALNSTAYRVTVPAYYDTVLQGKLTRDEESVRMLDLITAGTTTDFGLVFYANLDSSLYFTNQIIQNNEYTTWWAKNEQKITTNLQNIIDQLTEMEQNR